MAIITTYPLDASPVAGDYLVGSKITNTGGQLNPTKNFTIGSVVQAGLGYTVISQIISQAGASAPTVDAELENTTGTTFNWLRFNPGVYRIQAANPIFEFLKVQVFLNQGNAGPPTGPPIFISHGRLSDTLIEVNTWDATTLNLADTGFQWATFEVHIYS